MRMRNLEHKGLSRMQLYEAEMIQIAHQMFRTLLKYNMYSKERILELYDRLLYFPPNFTVPTQTTHRNAFEGEDVAIRFNDNENIPKAQTATWQEANERAGE